VEIALVVPLLLALAFGVVGISRVSRAQLGISALTREAARAGALSTSAGDAQARAAARGQSVAADHALTNGSLLMVIDVGGFGRGGEVVVVAAYQVALDDLPLMGWAKVPISSTHREMVDPYRSW
jgi:hypothetical protein